MTTQFACCLPGGLLGIILAFPASAATLYVNANNTNATPPYTNWTTAATNIQDAVDASGATDTVLVTNGVYQAGGTIVSGSLSNRVAVTKAVTLRSVNGPGATLIQGFQVQGTNGDGAVRCVYLTNGAALIGFTLTNGATRAAGDPVAEQGGGGLWCASAGVLVSNCVLKGNSAYYRGGGAYNGALMNCTLTANTAFLGGGAYAAALTNCLVTSNSVPVSSGSSAGGGGYSNVLANCALAFNSASIGGGAANSRLLNCTVTNNFASFGAGVDTAMLSGCTVRSNTASVSGGGAYSCTVTNCLLSYNASPDGGGAFSGTLTNCTLANNSATSTGSGGGAENSRLVNCLVVSNTAAYGSGLNNCVAINCTLTNNSVTVGSGYGGGSLGGSLTNCVVAGNSAYNGGGSFSGTLVNCTVAGNTASSGGGSYVGTLYNCIVYFNSALAGANSLYSTMNSCCTTPDPGGIANITNDPLLVNQPGGNLRLQSGSPCINSGNNAAISNTTDLDGNARISGATVDIGAYEIQNPPSVISYAWLQGYGLPTDGTADFVDIDGDGMNNWQEWRAGTSPIDPSSFLQLFTPAPGTSGITVTWQSGSGRIYFLQRGTNLRGHPIFSSIQSNIVGQAGVTSFTDTTAAGRGPFFYRVAVQ